MIERLTELLQAYFIDLSPELLANLISSLLIILVLWIGRYFAMRFIQQRFHERPRTLYNWRKSAEYAFLVLGILFVGRIWLAGLQSLVTYLGLVSAGLAIALQDLIINLAAWVTIIWRRPLQVGDRIQIGDHAGDVIDIRIFEFSLLEVGNRINAEQSTGRIIHIPNSTIFRDVLANYSQGLPYIWHEIPILVTFESDWEKAKALLGEILVANAPTVDQRAIRRSQQAGQRFVISYGHFEPIIYTSVESSGVLLTLRYLVAPRQRRMSEQVLWEAILRAFAQHWDIDFAYETQREFIHWREGKKPPTTPPKSSDTAAT